MPDRLTAFIIRPSYGPEILPKMKLAMCILICCSAGFAYSESSNAGYVRTDGTAPHDKLFDALISRIDQLEEKQEARDRLHQTEIDKLRHEHEKEIGILRYDYTTEIGKIRHDHKTEVDLLRHDLARQTVRINELEATVRRQDEQFDELRHTPDDASTSEEQDGMINASMDATESTETSKQQALGNQSNSAYVHREQSAISRKRIRRIENEIQVAFFATLSNTAHHIGVNQPVAFDHVVTNIGNSYNPHVGVFVAPVSGTYVFAVTLTTEDRDQARYGIFRNVEQITWIWVNGVENDYDASSQTAVLHLAKGDDVTIKHKESDHSLAGVHFSMFSGFLLSQDSTDSSPIVGK